MATLIQLLGGALACVLLVLIARRAGWKRELLIYAAALVIAALIYLGFAAAGGVAFTWTALAASGFVLFTLVAFVGWRISAWALVLGWTAHAAWDWWFDKVLQVTFVPEWYPFVCVGFDLFLAGYLTVRLKESRANVASLTSL